LLIWFSKFILLDFDRKPRSLSELCSWKGTKFRHFLLYYIGRLILKTILPTELYAYFLTLQIAMHILCSPMYITSMIDYAEELCIYFVKDFLILYEEEHVSYKIHNLIHLAEDCRKYGSLDSFSTFLFESNF